MFRPHVIGFDGNGASTFICVAVCECVYAQNISKCISSFSFNMLLYYTAIYFVLIVQ